MKNRERVVIFHDSVKDFLEKNINAWLAAAGYIEITRVVQSSASYSDHYPVTIVTIFYKTTD